MFNNVASIFSATILMNELTIYDRVRNKKKLKQINSKFNDIENSGKKIK